MKRIENMNERGPLSSSSEGDSAHKSIISGLREKRAECAAREPTKKTEAAAPPKNTRTLDELRQVVLDSYLDEKSKISIDIASLPRTTRLRLEPADPFKNCLDVAPQPSARISTLRSLANRLRASDRPAGEAVAGLDAISDPVFIPMFRDAALSTSASPMPAQEAASALASLLRTHPECNEELRAALLQVIQDSRDEDAFDAAVAGIVRNACPDDMLVLRDIAMRENGIRRMGNPWPTYFSERAASALWSMRETRPELEPDIREMMVQVAQDASAPMTRLSALCRLEEGPGANDVSSFREMSMWEKFDSTYKSPKGTSRGR